MQHSLETPPFSESLLRLRLPISNCKLAKGNTRLANAGNQSTISVHSFPFSSLARDSICSNLDAFYVELALFALLKSLSEQTFINFAFSIAKGESARFARASQCRRTVPNEPVVAFVKLASTACLIRPIVSLRLRSSIILIVLGRFPNRSLTCFFALTVHPGGQ